MVQPLASEVPAPTLDNLPAFMKERLCSNEEALQRTVRPGARIGSGFATSEPHTFYSTVWDFIRKNDLHDLRFVQALFMAPHSLCVGDALSAQGLFSGLAQRASGGLLGRPIKAIHTTTRLLDGVRRLTAHYDELRERRIVFRSAFVGAATNRVIPSNLVTRALYGQYRGRNTTRMGITDMQSIHFPDAVESMAYDKDEKPVLDTYVIVVTPPDANGEMSNGPGNGANAEVLERITRLKDMNVLMYVNPRYPFTRGYGDAPNSLHVDAFKGLALAGKLMVVEDQGVRPGVPKGNFDNPAPEETTIAEHVVNHIEMNRAYTYGRTIQVGIGTLGVLAMKALKRSSWSGRCYTEMLEPFTLELYEEGKLKGSHFIERDGRRTQLDGKLVCTFSMAEQDSPFYDKISNHPAVVMGAASRVVIPAAFQGGMGINNCLAVDFQGHLNSGGRDANHFSGIGGGAMILRGLADGGLGFMCLKSTHRTPEGKLRSSIFPFLPRGTPVSHVGPDIMGGRGGARIFIVTEYGVRQVSGLCQSDFIRALISIAHPDFRPWLKREAYRHFRVV